MHITYYSYVEYAEKFCACTKFSDDLSVLRRMSAYHSVLAADTELIPNLFNL